MSKKIPERRTKEKNKPLEENRVVWGVFARGLHLDVVVHIARPPLLHSAGTVCVARLGNDDDRQLFGVFRLLIFKTMSKERENAQTGGKWGRYIGDLERDLVAQDALHVSAVGSLVLGSVFRVGTQPLFLLLEVQLDQVVRLVFGGE